MPKFLKPLWPPFPLTAMYSTRVMPVSERTPRKTALLFVLSVNDCVVASRKVTTREAFTESGVRDESAAPNAVMYGENASAIDCGMPGVPGRYPPATRFGRDAAPEEE